MNRNNLKGSGTPDNVESGGTSQDIIRNAWKKLIECEERLTFWKKMVKLGIGAREVEHMCEDIRDKYRSEIMKSGKVTEKLLD